MEQFLRSCRNVDDMETISLVDDVKEDENQGEQSNQARDHSVSKNLPQNESKGGDQNGEEGFERVLPIHTSTPRASSQPSKQRRQLTEEAEQVEQVSLQVSDVCTAVSGNPSPLPVCKTRDKCREQLTKGDSSHPEQQSVIMDRQLPPTFATPTSPKNGRPIQVPEEVAELSPKESGATFYDPHIGELKDDDCHEGAHVADQNSVECSLVSNNFMDSLANTSDKLDKLTKGYKHQCVKNQMQHSKSMDDVRSLKYSLSSQQDEIEEIRWRLEALEKEVNMKAPTHKQTTVFTWHIPYDTIKADGMTKISYNVESDLCAQLFLQGIDDGQGTHLSLVVTRTPRLNLGSALQQVECEIKVEIVNNKDAGENITKTKQFRLGKEPSRVVFPKLAPKVLVEAKEYDYLREGNLLLHMMIRENDKLFVLGSV